MAEIAGLNLIVPTSVSGSGVSVSASGKVSFSAATTVSVNGCFTSTYDNYLIVGSTFDTADGEGFRVRLRASGSDASGSNYAFQVLYANSTTVAGGRVSSDTQATVMLTSGPNIAQGFHMYLYGPALAQATSFVSNNAATLGDNISLYDYGNTHSLSTAYDGFTLFPNSGTTTGAFTIYGLSQ